MHGYQRRWNGTVCGAFALLILSAPGLAVAAGPAPAAKAVNGEWAGKWAEDIRYLARELPAKHPNAFHSVGRESVQAAFDSLERRLPSLTHHQIISELAVIMASLGDGHTRLTIPLPPGSDIVQGHTSTPPPSSPELLCHLLPVRFVLLADGLFVDKIESPARWAVGTRVLQIGALPTAEAIAAVAPTVRGDNEYQIKSLLPLHLVIPEILEARGVIESPDEAALVLGSRAGERQNLVLKPVLDREVPWLSSEDRLPGDPPLYRRHPGENYWFESLGEKQAVYLRYREVQNAGDENIHDFADRLEAFLTANRADALIVDLRGNSGGNNYLNQPLLHAILCSPRVNRPGKLFVVIDRGTFSAALMLAVDLERHTKAVFVGEPTGGKPNHYGDSRKIQLPHSGLTVRISSLYWQYSAPGDERPWIAPQIEVPVGSEEYFSGRDPVVEEIEQILRSAGDTAATSLTGDWQGVLSARAEKIPFVLHLVEGDPTWEAELDLPELGVTGLELESVSVDKGQLRFTLSGQGVPIQFEGTLHDRWIIGEAEQGGVLSVFVAGRRKDSR